MWIVPEAQVGGLITAEESFAAVEAVFAAMARDGARNFDVIRETLGHAGAVYGFKSGFDREGLVLGLKSGGYWPENTARGLTNHQSTVCLFDPESGQCRAVVGGNLLTALRTAAAAAVSVAHLARTDARILGMIGAGHQAGYQLRAVAAQRQFEKVVAWNRTPEKLAALADVAASLGLAFEAASPEAVAARADVIVTVTSSASPLLAAGHVRPGTHLACMGTDTIGKMEVDPALLAGARVFTDEVAQSVSIGEAQHAIAEGLIAESDIAEIGSVIGGAHPGRKTDDEITLFDGTGVGLQDLAVANAVLNRAIAAGTAIEVDF